MRVELHDTVAVRADNADPVVPAGRRARLLLAALALADAPLSASRLADTLWGDELPATWTAALRGTVRSVRDALTPIGGGGTAVVATVPGGYCLAAGVGCDVRDDQDTLRHAEALAAEGRAHAVLAATAPLARRRGAALLRGEQAGWLAPHRASVDALALRAAELAVAAAGELGEHHVAADLARDAVEAHPLDERAHRLMIAALDRAGDRAGAVLAYETCRGTLAEELGVDPSAQTVALYLQVIREAGRPATRPPVPTSSFVAREAETARLLAALADPGVVTVRGRGGVGKTRLAQHILARTDVDGGRHWVSLAAIVADELVAAAVALQLAVEVGSGDPGDAVAAWLAPTGRTVLVLDGAEAVRDGAASLAAALVAAAPALTVLVTSRVQLGVDDERIVDVAPLAGARPGRSRVARGRSADPGAE